MWSAPLSQIHLQVSVSSLCFVAFKHKTNHMPVPSGLTGLQHSTYWLNHLTFTVSCFLATDAKWYIKINLRLQILQGICSTAQSISPLLQHSTNYPNFNFWIPAIIFNSFQTGGVLIVLAGVWSFWIRSLNGDSLHGFI